MPGTAYGGTPTWGGGGGARWRETIAAELEAARCMLVCWTSDSVGPAGTYVREEAERAKHRGVLLPLLLDRVAPPFGFGEVQALDLVDWDGRLQSPQWQVVLRAAEAIPEAKAPQAVAVLARSTALKRERSLDAGWRRWAVGQERS